MRTIFLAGALLATSAATAQGTASPSSLPTPPAVVAPTAPPAALPAALTPQQIAARDYATVVVCKTTVATGSLIARHKTCLTRKQWAYVNDENERQARTYVQDNTSKPGAN